MANSGSASQCSTNDGHKLEKVTRELADVMNEVRRNRSRTLQPVCQQLVLAELAEPNPEGKGKVKGKCVHANDTCRPTNNNSSFQELLNKSHIAKNSSREQGRLGMLCFASERFRSRRRIAGESRSLLVVGQLAKVTAVACVFRQELCEVHPLSPN